MNTPPQLLTRFLLAMIVALTMTDPSMAAEGWAQFRGPNGGGSLPALQHPGVWGAKKNLAWSTELPGGGWSSPVIAKGRLYVTTAVSKGWGRPLGFRGGVGSMRSYRSRRHQTPMSFRVICLRPTDGKVLWTKEVANLKPTQAIHPSNTYATESPVTDGEHVYVYFAAIGVVCCLDSEGRQVWKKEVGQYPTSSNFGTASSLALHGDRIFLQSDNQKSSFLMAINKSSGKESWKASRTGRTSWSSPLVWKNRRRVEVVACGSDGVTSYDPQTGSVNWRLTGTGGSFSSSPAVDQERIYFGNSGPGRSGPLVAVSCEANGSMSLSSPGVAWFKSASGPGMASPVAHEGKVYVAGRGVISCYDAKNGERLYKKRLPQAANIASSLWACGDRLFALDEAGTTFVIKTGKDFELVARNSLSGLYWSTPSIAGPALFLRSADKLHCIRQTAAQAFSGQSPSN